MKKSLLLILSSILLVTVVLIGIGILFNKDDNQKQQGLTDIYALSSDGEVAYVSYDKGQATINLNDQHELVQLPVEKEIADLIFSEDGTHLAYIVRNKDLENTTSSYIHMLELDSQNDELIYESENIITEIAFDPKNPEKLFYIQADDYTNYSPIASRRPHDFDIHSYDLNEKLHVKHTDLKEYGMASLEISAEKDSVYVQMNDYADNETAEETFESKERIFEISLDTPDEKTVISSPVEEDVYDFILNPEKHSIIYQAVAGAADSGTYEYELFSLNWETNEVVQLTTLKKSTSKPLLGPEDKIYFMVDRKFAEREADYHLYRMNQDGSGVEEIQLVND